MKREEFQFEVCANSVESCLAAREGGADRVELCAGMSEGGVTPSYGEIVQARRLLADSCCRLHVIIRTRGGDFCYSEMELERMESDITMCKRLGVDGVVFGCLTPEGDIDTDANIRLLSAARPLSVTFHRAFDRTRTPVEALEKLVSLGFDRILTSGCRARAIEGVDLLAVLNKQSAGRIALMAGSGVCEENIREIYNRTDIHEYHFSARVEKPGLMKNYDSAVYMGKQGIDENLISVTSADRVEATIARLLG